MELDFLLRLLLMYMAGMIAGIGICTLLQSPKGGTGRPPPARTVCQTPPIFPPYADPPKINKNKAAAILTGFEGSATTQSGDMVLVVSVDLHADDYDGRISANDRITEGDYIALMKVVCEQCFANLKDPSTRSMAAFALRGIIAEACGDAASLIESEA